jgi:hypothetical protein
MNVILGIDSRYSWLATILKGLAGGFGEIRRLSEQHGWFDGFWQLEYAEPILGMAFVATQAYLIGVVADVGRSSGNLGKDLQDFVKDNKIGFYSDDPRPIAGNQSRVVLINATANYYKHHDEWGGWNTNETARQLEASGIHEHTKFPCLLAAEVLFNKKNFTSLSILLAIASEWRGYVINKYVRKISQYG